MNIQLTKVHHSNRFSQETNMFDAVVTIDGVPAFTARNDGHGGCDHYQALDGKQHLLKAAQEQCKKLPKIKSGFTDVPEMENDLEFVIADLLEKHLTQKSIVTKMKKNLLFTQNGKTGVFQYKLPVNPVQYAKAAANGKILNDLPIEEAVTLFMASVN